MLSSHLLSQVEAICNRIAIVHNGVIVHQGDVADLLVRADEVAIRASGLSDEAITAVEAAITEAGGRVVSTGPPKDHLESRFMELVEGNEGTDSSENLDH